MSRMFLLVHLCYHVLCFCDISDIFYVVGEETEKLSGRVFDSRSMCCRFEPHW